MNLRTRITVSALAITMAASTIAALPPVKQRGLAERIGGPLVVYAASDTAAQPILERLNALYAALLAGDAADVQDIRALRSEIAALDELSNLKLIDPIWNKIEPRLPATVDKAELRLTLFRILKDIGTSFYDPEAGDLQAIRQNAVYRKALHTIAVAGGDTDVTMDQLLIFLFGDGKQRLGVEGTARKLIGGLKQSELLQLLTSNEKRNDLIYKGMDELLSKPDQYEFSAVLVNLDITAQDIRSTVYNFQTRLTAYQPAAGAFLVAYLRMSTKATVEVSSGGRKHQYRLAVEGVEVPSIVLTWSKLSGSKDVTVSPSGVVTIPDNVNSASAVIEAKLLNPLGGEDKVIFQQKITLTASNNGGGNGGNNDDGNNGNGGGNNGNSGNGGSGGGNNDGSGNGGSIIGGGGVGSGSPNGFTGGGGSGSEMGNAGPSGLSKANQVLVNEFQQTLKKFITRVDAASSSAQRVQLVRQVLKEAQALLEKTGNIAPVNVVSDNGIAVAAIDAEMVNGVLPQLGQMSEVLNDLLSELNQADKLKPSIMHDALVINLGNVTDSAAQINIPAAVVQNARKEGISYIEAVVNGFKAVVPLQAYSGDVVIQLSWQGKENVNNSGLLLDSAVYKLGLAVGGKKVTALTQPIMLHIPLANSSGGRTNRSSAVKLDEDGIEFLAGPSGENYQVKAYNTNSSYAIARNDIVFHDLVKVKSWAGEEIAWIAAKGIINGRADGLFTPSENVTRAEFAKMLVRALNMPFTGAPVTFKDVNPSSWYAPYVGTAVQNGLVNGRTAALFAPDAAITRGEIATMVARALKLAGGYENDSDVGAVLASYADVSTINPSLRQGVAFGVEYGIVGVGSPLIEANRPATRAEAAVILQRSLKLLDY